MRRPDSVVVLVLALVLISTAVAQTTRRARAPESAPGLKGDPLTLMALPAPPVGVRAAKYPVMTVGGVKLESADLVREIVAIHWNFVVDALVQRKILELELSNRKVKFSEVDLEREAARLLSISDPQATWSQIAMTNPQAAATLREQARDSLGWAIASRPPGTEEDADQDPKAQAAKSFGVRVIADKYKTRKRYEGAPLAEGIAADVTAPDGKIDAVLDQEVLEGLRLAVRYEHLVAAREALIDDWLLGCELAKIGESVSAADVAKQVAAMNEKYKPPFAWKMICQFKGTTPELEIGMFRRLMAWKKLTGFAPKAEDIQAFAKEREMHYRGEYRNVRQVVFRTVDPLTGGALEQGMQNQAAAQAKEAYEALKGGADFAEFARDKSEDTATAASGGVVNQPFKRYGGLAEDQGLADAVWALTPENPVSKPVKGAKGWYVFKLEKVNPPNARLSFENLSEPNFVDWISSDYERAKLAEYLANLRNKADIKPGSDVTLTTGW
jgi:hypothetical protein